MIEDLQPSRFSEKLLRVSLIILPFVSYAGLVGLAGVLILVAKNNKVLVPNSLVKKALLGISFALVVSSVFAYNKQEALLQLTNFLPFFALFVVLAFLLRRPKKLEQIATDLVIASIPINITSFLEYVLKSPAIAATASQQSALAWFFRHDYGHRANSFFGHPNILASYLVVIFGLGLGLILQVSVEQRLLKSVGAIATNQALVGRTKFYQDLNTKTLLLFVSTYLNLVGIFSSGSRNGIVIAISQILIFSFFVKVNRTVFITGITSLLVIVGSVVSMGIGGRVFSLSGIINDPRVNVWNIALDLALEKPFLGWGLGNYKLIYPLRNHDPIYIYIAHPHNFWVLLGTETGLVILFALTGLVGYICYRGVRAVLAQQADTPRAIALGYLLAFWGCTTFALFDVTFYDARVNVLNWLVLAGICSFGWVRNERVRSGEGKG